MFEIGWTLRTEIHYDVEDCAARGAHEFCLRCRRKLEMHSAKRPPPCAESDIRLCYHRVQPVFSQLFLAEGAREEAATVIPRLDIYNKGALKVCISEFHIGQPPLSKI